MAQRLVNERIWEAITYISVLIAGGLVTYGFAKSIIIHGSEKFYDVNFGEFSIAIATFMLAVFTYHLAQNEIHESRDERRRLRIKEQLEGLYSPLMSRIENFDPQFAYGQHQRGIRDLMEEIRYKYEFLSTNELRDLFRRYYDHQYIVQLTQVEWRNFMNELRQTIIDDFERLTEEYNELTARSR